MSIFREFFKKQSHQNVHENALIAPYFPNNFCGASICPRTPLAYACN